MLFHRFTVSLVIVLMTTVVIPSNLRKLTMGTKLTAETGLDRLRMGRVVPALAVTPSVAGIIVPRKYNCLVLSGGFGRLCDGVSSSRGRVTLLCTGKRCVRCTAKERFTLIIQRGRFYILECCVNSRFAIS